MAQGADCHIGVMHHLPLVPKARRRGVATLRADDTTKGRGRNATGLARPAPYLPNNYWPDSSPMAFQVGVTRSTHEFTTPTRCAKGELERAHCDLRDVPCAL